VGGGLRSRVGAPFAREGYRAQRRRGEKTELNAVTTVERLRTFVHAADYQRLTAARGSRTKLAHATAWWLTAPGADFHCTIDVFTTQGTGGVSCLSGRTRRKTKESVIPKLIGFAQLERLYGAAHLIQRHEPRWHSRPSEVEGERFEPCQIELLRLCWSRSGRNRALKLLSLPESELGETTRSIVEARERRAAVEGCHRLNRGSDGHGAGFLASLRNRATITGGS
jgi:hypothetical protein